MYNEAHNSRDAQITQAETKKSQRAKRQRRHVVSVVVLLGSPVKWRVHRLVKQVPTAVPGEGPEFNRTRYRLKIQRSIGGSDVGELPLKQSRNARGLGALA